MYLFCANLKQKVGYIDALWKTILQPSMLGIRNTSSNNSLFWTRQMPGSKISNGSSISTSPHQTAKRLKKRVTKQLVNVLFGLSL